MTDQRGTPVYTTSSNRAGWASNASQANNGGLLAANGEKRLDVGANDVKPITPPPGTPNPATWQRPVSAPSLVAIASRLWIKNSSGQKVDLVFTVAKNVHGDQADTSAMPLQLLDGEEVTIHERVTSILEKNTGAGTQTGLGVRYYATLEPRLK